MTITEGLNGPELVKIPPLMKHVKHALRYSRMADVEPYLTHIPDEKEKKRMDSIFNPSRFPDPSTATAENAVEIWNGSRVERNTIFATFIELAYAHMDVQKTTTHTSRILRRDIYSSTEINSSLIIKNKENHNYLSLEKVEKTNKKGSSTPIDGSFIHTLQEKNFNTFFEIEKALSDVIFTARTLPSDHPLHIMYDTANRMLLFADKVKDTIGGLKDIKVTNMVAIISRGAATQLKVNSSLITLLGEASINEKPLTRGQFREIYSRMALPLLSTLASGDMDSIHIIDAMIEKIEKDSKLSLISRFIPGKYIHFDSKNQTIIFDHEKFMKEVSARYNSDSANDQTTRCPALAHIRDFVELQKKFISGLILDNT